MKPAAIKHALFLLLVLLPVLAVSSCGERKTADLPAAKNGILDLQGFDLGRSGPIPLRGEWEFHWNRLAGPESVAGGKDGKTFYLTIPGAWNGTPVNGEKISGNGCATYRLRITSAPQGEIAFRIIYMATAYRLFINGGLKAENGRVGMTRQESVPGLKPLTVSFINDRPEMELVLQVSNFHHRVGGAWLAPVMGKECDIALQREKRLAWDLFLTGSIIMMFLYHLSLFFILKKRSWYLFHFSLLCLVIALRVMFSGEYHITHVFTGLSWTAINRLEYLFFVVAVPLTAMFTHALYPDEFKKAIVRIIQGTSLLLALIIAVTPPWIYTWTAHAFQVFTLLSGLYLLAVLAAALHHGREGAFIMLAGLTLLFCTAVNDILHDDRIIDTGYFVPAGLLVFIFSQAFLLAIKLSRSFRDVEILSDSLRKKSRDLEFKNIALEKTQIKLEDLNRGLEEKVRERTSELATVNEKLENMAHYDQLTGVPNRWLFYDRLRLIIEQSRRDKAEFAVFYMDLDGFKEVNDEYGHETGDMILKELTKRIEAILRKSDTLGRLGGDEFVFLIPGIKESSDAVQTAEKILSTVKTSFIINDMQINFSASMGISLFPTDSDNPEELVTMADKAMYLAKKSGKNRFIFYKSIN